VVKQGTHRDRRVDGVIGDRLVVKEGIDGVTSQRDLREEHRADDPQNHYADLQSPLEDHQSLNTIYPGG